MTRGIASSRCDPTKYINNRPAGGNASRTSRRKIKQLIRIRVSSSRTLPLYSSNGVPFVGRGTTAEGGSERINGGRGNTSTGGWREMAAIFPAGSSREPIASLLRALRRQLRLKNCLCHVRHIFLAFPLFSPPAPEVPGLLSSHPSLLSSSYTHVRTYYTLSLSFSLAPKGSRSAAIFLVLRHPRRTVSHLLFSLFSRTKPRCTPKVFPYI